MITSSLEWTCQHRQNLLPLWPFSGCCCLTPVSCSAEQVVGPDAAKVSSRCQSCEPPIVLWFVLQQLRLSGIGLCMHPLLVLAQNDFHLVSAHLSPSGQPEFCIFHEHSPAAPGYARSSLSPAPVFEVGREGGAQASKPHDPSESSFCCLLAV